MVSCFVPLVLATAMGQTAPAEASWLKSIPADVAVAARVKAPETVRDDLLTMIEKMSPNAAALVRPQIEQGLTIFSAQYGDPAVKYPFFAVFRLPAPGEAPPWAVLVEADDYPAVLKSVSGKADATPKSMGGYDSFEKADGQTWYGAKGAGFVAFGPDEALVKGISKPSAALDEKISADHKARLLGGDLGVYVNVAALQAQYSDQIEQGRQAFMGVLDQAGGQMPGNMSESLKSLYGRMFDSLKVGEALSFNLDFDPDALDVSAFTTVKPGTPAAESLADAEPGTAPALGNLPADATTFVYFKLSPDALASLQKLGFSFMGGGKPSPEMEKGLALSREAGVTESYAALSGNSFRDTNINVSMPEDPAKAVEGALLTSKSLAGGEGMVKAVQVVPETQSYKGFTFHELKTTIDLEKMNLPGGADAAQKMFGGDTVTSWLGSNGTTMLTIAAPTFAEAKPLIDSVLSGQGSIGSAPSFQAIRKALPKDVNALFLLQAQGLVRQVAKQIGMVAGKAPDVPADMPKEPAFLGGALTVTPKGYSLRFRVPSNVGPVLERGLVPVIQGMQGIAVQ